jgi:Na+:H+ antiporter, NhaA family
MSDDLQANTEFSRLPRELVDRVTKPFARFLHIETAGGVVLLFFTVAALALSNSPWANAFLNAWETPVGIQVGSLEFTRSLREWINDALTCPHQRRQCLS